jgi:hypothetical protein
VASRRDRVAPPPRAGGWDLRFGTGDAVSGWEKLCAAAPANARSAWNRITADPRQRDSRQHPLKGRLSTRVVSGEPLEQWQYEVTGAGRLWYCIDGARRIVWLTDAYVGHPKSTE